jgi:hypothetical protein
MCLCVEMHKGMKEHVLQFTCREKLYNGDKHYCGRTASFDVNSLA